jgi:hypothetical protein
MDQQGSSCRIDWLEIGIAVSFSGALVACSSGTIRVYDNYDSASPRLISSSLVLGENPNCGCPDGTLPTLEGALASGVIPAVDRPVECRDYRPINTRREGAQVGFLRINIFDEEGVGCVEVVVSGSSHAGVIDADPSDAAAVVPAAHGPGQCAAHEHEGHSPDDVHYRFDFDASRTFQSPRLSFYRYGDPLLGSGGTYDLHAWVRVSYVDGSANRKGAVPVYVSGPITNYACR